MLAHIVDYRPDVGAWRAVSLQGERREVLLQADLFPQFGPGDTVEVTTDGDAVQAEKVTELNEADLHAMLTRGLLR